MISLKDEIESYRKVFKEKVPKENKDKMNQATKKLEDLHISENAKKVGEKLENENFLNIHEKEVSLHDYLKDNDFLVINFYRGAWCPYCNLELKALQNILPELKQLNSQLIAVSPQTPDNSLSTKEKNEIEFEVLSDLKNKVAKKYGLVFTLDESLIPIYESFGINIPESNADKTYELPMPATFIIDKNSTIIYSFVNEDYTKREEPQKILDIIQKNS